MIYRNKFMANHKIIIIKDLILRYSNSKGKFSCAMYINFCHFSKVKLSIHNNIPEVFQIIEKF
jgi:hypothetical protein